MGANLGRPAPKPINVQIFFVNDNKMSKYSTRPYKRQRFSTNGGQELPTTVTTLQSSPKGDLQVHIQGANESAAHTVAVVNDERISTNFEPNDCRLGAPENATTAE